MKVSYSHGPTTVKARRAHGVDFICWSIVYSSPDDAPGELIDGALLDVQSPDDAAVLRVLHVVSLQRVVAIHLGLELLVEVVRVDLEPELSGQNEDVHGVLKSEQCSVIQAVRTQCAHSRYHKTIGEPQ